MTLIDAQWIGPSGYRLPDGTALEHGVTVCKVSEGEAKASDNWQPVPTKKKDKD